MHEPTSWMPNLHLEHYKEERHNLQWTHLRLQVWQKARPAFPLPPPSAPSGTSAMINDHQLLINDHHNQLNSISSSSTSALCTNWKQGPLFLVYRGETSLEKTPYFQRIYKKLSQAPIFRPFLPIFTYKKLIFWKYHLRKNSSFEINRDPWLEETRICPDFEVLKMATILPFPD